MHTVPQAPPKSAGIHYTHGTSSHTKMSYLLLEVAPVPRLRLPLPAFLRGCQLPALSLPPLRLFWLSLSLPLSPCLLH